MFREVFMNISYNAPFNPSLNIHYDFDAGKGTYYTFGFNHNLETSAGNLSLGTNLFYQDNYYENSGFPSIEVNGSYEYNIDRKSTRLNSSHGYISYAVFC